MSLQKKILWEMELITYLKNGKSYHYTENIEATSKEHMSKQLCSFVNDKLFHTSDAIRVEGIANEIERIDAKGLISYAYGSDPLMYKKDKIEE